MSARKKILLALLVLSSLAVWLVAQYQMSERELVRIHEANMSRAHTFKNEFDRHLKPGASMPEVDAFLNARAVHVVKSNIGSWAPEYQVEVAEESVPGWWYCGPGSVGVIAKFTGDERLKSSEVSVWSFNCP